MTEADEKMPCEVCNGVGAIIVNIDAGVQACCSECDGAGVVEIDHPSDDQWSILLREEGIENAP